MAGEKILMIDDEDDIRTVVQMSLQMVGGFEVFLASSGAEGLEIAERERPDLILLDAMMPDLDGPGTIKLLKENPASSGIPVVFLTAKTQRTDLEHLQSLGAAGVLTKPFDPMKLAEQVREFMP